MTKVLIAIDYNPVSEEVAEKGYALAKRLDAEICLLHILNEVGFYEPHYPTFLGYEGYTAFVGPDFDLSTEMRNIAEDFLKKAAEHLGDPRVSTHLAEGDTSKTLLSYAEEWEADVIVMGTHSHSTLEKLLLGTVAEKVIEKTQVPVYLVPIKK